MIELFTHRASCRAIADNDKVDGAGLVNWLWDLLMAHSRRTGQVTRFDLTPFGGTVMLAEAPTGQLLTDINRFLKAKPELGELDGRQLRCKDDGLLDIMANPAYIICGSSKLITLPPFVKLKRYRGCLRHCVRSRPKASERSSG